MTDWRTAPQSIPSQELDPRGVGPARFISPDILRYDHCGEAALVFTPPHDAGDGALSVLAFNLGALASRGSHPVPGRGRGARNGPSLLLGRTRLLFLGGDHYRRCEALGELHSLLADPDTVGIGGACGRLLPFDPSTLPGFHRCDIDVVDSLMAAAGSSLQVRHSCWLDGA
jgi:hypothetical protein